MSPRWCACCGYRHPDTGAYICRFCMANAARQAEMRLARQYTDDPLEQRAFLVNQFAWHGWTARGGAIPVASPPAAQTGIESGGLVGAELGTSVPATTRGR